MMLTSRVLRMDQTSINERGLRGTAEEKRCCHSVLFGEPVHSIHTLTKFVRMAPCLPKQCFSCPQNLAWFNKLYEQNPAFLGPQTPSRGMWITFTREQPHVRCVAATAERLHAALLALPDGSLPSFPCQIIFGVGCCSQALGPTE